MADSNPVITQSTVNSLARHVVSATSGFTIALVGVATILSQLHVGGVTIEQVASIKSAGDTLVAGVTSVTGALATIVLLGSTTWAWFASRASNKAASLVKEVPGTTVVTSPAVAAAVPSEKVVPNTTNSIVRTSGL